MLERNTSHCRIHRVDADWNPCRILHGGKRRIWGLFQRVMDRLYILRSDEQQRADYRCRCACCRNQQQDHHRDSRSAGILLLLLLLAGATIFYFLKIQRPSLPDFSGVTGRDPSIDNLPNRRSSTRQNMSIDSVTSDDKAAFQQLLIDVQRAWSKQDLTELRQFVTPEMLNYFSAALADNTSQDIQNHVDDVVLLHAEVLEAWTEQTTRYVTAGLRWSARDYNLSLKKQRGEPGYVVAGSEETPTESREAWTFMESPDGKWLLSAIQQ